MLVAVDDDRLALALRDRHRDDFLRQPTVRLRCGGLGLAADGKGVLVFAADAKIRRDVLASLGHRVDAVLLLHERVDKAPADGGVVDLGVAREGGICLRHDEGCTRHALDTASDHQFGFAGFDCPRRSDHRIHAGTAEPVDRRAGYADRQASQKQRHARDVAVVLAGLVGAAEDYVIDRVPVDIGVAFEECLEWDRAEVVGSHRGE
ncbi:hypothetical protein D9M72_529150 [compost metagenome]